MVRYGERTFLEFEKPVLSQLSDFNSKMLFIVTKSPFKLNDEEFEEYQDTLCDDIKDMFKNTNKNIVNKLFGEDYCDLMKSIFPVNSKKEKKEDEEFGLDTLLEKCYDIFKNEKLPYEILLELENGEEKHIEEILAKYMLFRVYKSRKDIISSAKKRAMQKIIKFSLYSTVGAYLPSFGNSSNVERLSCAMASSLAKVYAKNLSKDEAKTFVDSILKRKEEIINNSDTNSIGRTIWRFICLPLAFISWPAGLCTFFVCNLIGIKIYKLGVELSNNLAKDLEGNIPFYLFSLAISFNKGIESLKTMKENYNIFYIKEKSNAAPTP